MNSPRHEIKTFQHLHDLGFGHLMHPIIPGTKRPGIHKGGTWYCPNEWQRALRMTTSSIAVAQKMFIDEPAGIGLLCDGLFVLDLDLVDPKLADRIRAIIFSVTGEMPPERWGRRPCFMWRCAKGIKSLPMVYFPDHDGETQKVEFIGHWRQVMVAGRHPETGTLYYFTEPLPRYEDLPEVTNEQLWKIHEAILELPGAMAGGKVVEMGDHRPDGGHIGERMPAEIVRQVVEQLLENDYRFDAFNDWLNICYAMRNAAGPEGESIAFDWTMTNPKSDAAKAEKILRGIARGAAGKSGYGTIARYVIERHGVDALRKVEREAAAAWYQEDAFDHSTAPPEPEPEPGGIWRDAMDLDKVPKPEFLIDRYVPERGVMIVFGASGSLKTFLTLGWMCSTAYGRTDWHGSPIKQPEGGGTCFYIAGEDFAGFRQRHEAWVNHNGAHGVERGRLIFRTESIRMMDAKQRRAMIADMKRQANGRPIPMVVVDTVMKTAAGLKMASPDDAMKYIEACYEIEKALGCVVILVHHTVKYDKEQMRDSSVFETNTDAIAGLVRNSKQDLDTFLTAVKYRNKGDGWRDKVRFMKDDAADSFVSIAVERDVDADRPAGRKSDSRKRDTAMSVMAALNGLAGRRGTVREIRAAMGEGMTKQGVQDRLDELLLKGDVNRTEAIGRGGKTWLYVAVDQ